MKLYLCAPHSNWFIDAMKVYLAGPSNGYTENCMKVYLAGTNSRDYVFDNHKNEKLYVLESFYYVKDWMLPYIKNKWNFLLDSGAFTFMNDKKSGKIDWNNYTEKYAQFINDNNIDLFFELDIDSIIGLKQVEKLRYKLEKLTNKQCIPVWHPTRGKEYWEKMIDQYSYVALGGMAANVKYKNKIEKYFPYFINSAKQKQCKVHALGYTKIKNLHKYKFHSVDSTAWLYGNRGGFLYQFTGNDIEQIKTKNKKLKSKPAAIHNFIQWVKFQKYAEKNL